MSSGASSPVPSAVSAVSAVSASGVSASAVSGSAVSASAVSGSAASGQDEVKVPLMCMLCPKKPTFSDESHLLTHISSKGHLHQQFSTGLRAVNDPKAKERMSQYEEWYEKYNMKQLLAERMANKGDKKPTRTRRAARQSTGSVDTRQFVSLTTPDQRGRMQGWNSGPVGGVGYNAGYYNSPIPLRHRVAYSHIHDGEDGSMDSSMMSTPSGIDGSFVGYVEYNEVNSRLKGIIWPGMDLFDSATPAMKKMRNQRKDDAAIEYLKLTSENISAVEAVWSADQSHLRKEKDLYATPSEPSAAGTPPQKRKYRRNVQESLFGHSPLRSMKAEDEDDDDMPPMKRGGRHGVQTRSQMASTVGVKQSVSAGELAGANPVQEDSYVMGPPKARDYGVYHNGNASVSDHGNMQDGSRDNTDNPYFKSGSHRYFDQSAEAGHMQYRPQPSPSPYGNGFQGMSGSSLGAIASQPRSAMYPQFGNNVYGQIQSADGASNSYNGTASRFGPYGMEAASSPFGFGEQRDINAPRDDAYTEEPYPTGARMYNNGA